MLERLDRILVVVDDLDRAEDDYTALFDARSSGDDISRVLGAARRRMLVGRSVVELLRPNDNGPVADFAARRGQGLYGVGFSSRRVDRLRERFTERGVDFASEGEQIYLDANATGGHGMPVVITPETEEPIERVGLVESIYECTNIVSDHRKVAAEYADLFGLDSAVFHELSSDQYGYEGTLTLFHPEDRLDRIEVVTTTDPTKTMGRFGGKWGECMYMFYMEAADVGAIRDRLLERSPDDWTGPLEGDNPDGLFVHPNALAGVLCGVSRTTVGWLWSGKPERVERT